MFKGSYFSELSATLCHSFQYYDFLIRMSEIIHEEVILKLLSLIHLANQA